MNVSYIYYIYECVVYILYYVLTLKVMQVQFSEALQSFILGALLVCMLSFHVCLYFLPARTERMH